MPKFDIRMLLIPFVILALFAYMLFVVLPLGIIADMFYGDGEGAAVHDNLVTQKLIRWRPKLKKLCGLPENV